MPAEKIECSNCGENRAKYAKGVCERCYKTIRLFNSPKIKCQCSEECQEMIHSITFDGKTRTFKKGHEMTGPLSKNWKGGIRNDKDGYIYLKSPNHPFKDSMGYVPQHRLIYEHYLKIMTDQDIYLPPKILDVHHINENVRDNRLINLELMTRGQHQTYHNKNRKKRF